MDTDAIDVENAVQECANTAALRSDAGSALDANTGGEKFPHHAAERKRFPAAPARERDDFPLLCGRFPVKQLWQRYENES